MYPILLKIGPLSIKSYGFMLMIGFIVGIYWTRKEAVKKGINKDLIFDLGIYVIIASLVGARLLYVLLNFNYFRQDLLSIFLPREGGIGGLSFHGGILGGILVGLWFSRKRGVSAGDLADITAPSIALGTVFGRIGCFLNGCCGGLPSSVFWCVKFPYDGICRHPAQLYASFLNFLLFIGIIYSKKFQKFPGQIFFHYLIGYSVIRFILEFFRKGVSAEVFLFNITQAQTLCIFIIIISSLVLIIKSNK